MRKDDILLHEAYDKVYENLESLEEGILRRAGAKAKAAFSSLGTYGKNLGSAIVGGKGTGVSPRETYNTRKLQNIRASLMKDILNDLTKAGFLGKGFEATEKHRDYLYNVIDHIIEVLSNPNYFLDTETTSTTTTETPPTEKAGGTFGDF